MCFPQRVLLAALLAPLPLLLQGCFSFQADTAARTEWTRRQVEQDQIRQDLVLLANLASLRVQSACDEINALSPGPATARHTATWQLDLVPYLNKVARQEDSNRAMIDYAILITFQRYMAETTAVKNFGPEGGAVAIDACRKMEERYFRWLSTRVPAEKIRKLQNLIQEELASRKRDDTLVLASINEIASGLYHRQEFQFHSGGMLGGLDEGLMDTASQLHTLNTQVEGLWSFATDVPDYSRWTAQILVAETLNDTTVSNTLSAVPEMRRDIGRVADSLQTLEILHPRRVKALGDAIVESALERVHGLLLRIALLGMFLITFWFAAKHVFLRLNRGHNHDRRP